MKIFNNPNITQVMKLYNKTVKPTEKTGEVATSQDKLEISQKAQEFQVALKAYKNLPEIRQEKVEILKEQVQTNSYNVSGKEVADQLIESILIDKKV
ncbi:anti-sigma-28 factor, FlgM family [Natronincola peptidivorans]|uniref:Negative regulator of flagellin synthesis n=1 Tax=Natronincola peptidivorans TaxID=426128 RepID=A0A1H9ZRA6_9FIRM|nr:flagellar biosynthesis anti-sigma factor FlgM [Natronincola peptidivorans]SES84187.1 anti-sigma-28 factor, FlgM family [Natronincola peptidivorans]